MSFRYPKGGFISSFYDPLQVPNAPTIGTATGGDAQASVAFTAPSNVGGSAITAYYAVSNPGQITATAASSPITVTGLSNGTAYTFTVWALNSYGPSAYSAASGSVTPAAPTGLFGGGESGFGAINVISYINIASAGNAIDFGDLSSARQTLSSCSSSTLGLFAGGYGGATNYNIIDYVTIASAGNASDFGDLLNTLDFSAGCSNSTRGLIGGGSQDTNKVELNVIQYITIASAGNATDFGDLTVARYSLAACASPTRGLFAGGNPDGTRFNVIDYVTIASAGNATDFGDLVNPIDQLAGCSSSTRGLFGGGVSQTTTERINIIGYVTIASAGNTTDFGDLTAYIARLSATSSEVRGVFGGGQGGGSPSGGGLTLNTISYVTIASLGNASGFGDLTVLQRDLAACSNAHGGL